MSLLAGTQTFVSGTNTAISEKVGYAQKFTPLKNGTAESFELRTGSSLPTCTSFKVFICENTGGHPGAVVAEATYTGTPAKEKWILVNGSVKSGVLSTAKEYWEVIIPFGGALYLEAHGESTILKNKVPAKIEKPSEATEWAEKTLTGQFYTAVLGTEETAKGTAGALGLPVGTATATKSVRSAAGALGAALSVASTGHKSGEAKGALGLPLGLSSVGAKRVTRVAGALGAVLSVSSSGAKSSFGTAGAISLVIDLPEGAGHGPLQDAAPESEPINAGKAVQAASDTPFAVKLPTFKKVWKAEQLRITPSVAAAEGEFEFAILSDEGAKPGKTVIAKGTVKHAPEKGKALFVEFTQTGIIYPGQSSFLWIRSISGTLTQQMELSTSTEGATPYFTGPAKKGKKAGEVASGEWVEKEKLGWANVVILGYPGPEHKGELSVPVALASKTSSSRTTTGQIHNPVQVGTSGFGHLVRTGQSLPLNLSSTVHTVRSALGAMSFPLGIEGSGFSSAGRYGAGTNQVVKTYVPKTLQQTLVVMVHGGGWVDEQWEMTGTYANNLYKDGVGTVILPNYRDASSTEGAFPGQFEDIEASVNWALAHTSELNLIANPHVVLVGGSAGGHIVSMVAERMNAANPGTIDGVCTLSGIYDIRALVELMESGEPYKELTWPTKSVNNLTEHVQEALQEQMVYTSPFTGEKGVTNLGHGPFTNAAESRRAQERASPQQGTVSGARWLLFNSNEDLIPNSQVENFNLKLQGEGRSSEYRSIIEKGHSFTYWAKTGPEGKTVREEVGKFILSFTGEGEGRAALPFGLSSKVNSYRTASGSISLPIGEQSKTSSVRTATGSLKAVISVSGHGGKGDVGQSLLGMPLGLATRTRVVRSTAGALSQTLGVNGHSQGPVRGQMSLSLGVTGAGEQLRLTIARRHSFAVITMRRLYAQVSTPHPIYSKVTVPQAYAVVVRQPS